MSDADTKASVAREVILAQRARIRELETALMDAAEKLERGHQPGYVAGLIRVALGPDQN
jgi:hypothetical protein